MVQRSPTSSPSSSRFVSRYGSGGSGEQGQTYFIERQNSRHRNLHKLAKSASHDENNTPYLPFTRNNSYGNLSESRKLLSNTDSQRRVVYGAPMNQISTIRFQVVVWNIGKLDVVTGAVPMTFRISLFWNDLTEEPTDGASVAMSEDGSFSMSSHNVWKMHGRHKAFQQELRDMPIKAIEVPPVSILNVATFETIGSAEIDMLDDSKRLMRWTCMYRATVLQENLRVENFPHDDHDIQLKLAILSQREKGRQWDRRIWKLALATADDAQNSTRVPHGLIVDQVRLPGFTYNKERGLDFQFCSLNHGSFDHGTTDNHDIDMYLKVSLNVLRESGYYDYNIVPLLALLNVVAVSVLTFEDKEFFYRALITLNIAFNEMSIRRTADTHLPSVGYEIRLQQILNEFFVVLMALVFEAMIVYVLREYYDVSKTVTLTIDWLMAIIAVAHNIYTLFVYYQAKRKARRRLDFGWRPQKKRK